MVLCYVPGWMHTARSRVAVAVVVVAVARLCIAHSLPSMQSALCTTQPGPPLLHPTHGCSHKAVTNERELLILRCQNGRLLVKPSLAPVPPHDEPRPRMEGEHRHTLFPGHRLQALLELRLRLAGEGQH